VTGRDAGTLPGDDASVGDDAGAPDAGPECVCPPVPTTCVLPEAGAPTFTPEGDTLGQLFGALACADVSIHAAFYETTWECIVDAFEARLIADPDLVVQLVIDDDQCPSVNGGRVCALSRLEGDPRVTIVDDQRSRYMHHKFAVIDDRAVWVSSANNTRASFCSDHNNSLVVDEPGIVAGYEAEFQRMFTDRDFGPAMRAPIEAGDYTLFFGPQSPLTAPPAWYTGLVQAIDTASVSVDFMVFALTRAEIPAALVAAQARGVTVRGLVDSQYAGDPAVRILTDAMVPVRVAEMHSKVLIVDGALVATGSPNWSSNAWENDEASLWIRSSTVAAAYTAELERIYQVASPP
ncbi:phospholipase D-like domain-containing protein, partial [Myxococcota bacterium]|nr:phospholipase D-like domain-containing protein [Myxococcota bacterium]